MAAADQPAYGDRRPSRRTYKPDQPEGLTISFRELYDLPTSPEFLFHEEALRSRRTWGEDLTFYPGCGYLVGRAAGAAAGLKRAAEEAERGESMKLRAAASSTSAAPRARVRQPARRRRAALRGDRERRGGLRDADGWANTVAAGIGTAALYRAAAGPRAAIVGSAIGGSWPARRSWGGKH